MLAQNGEPMKKAVAVLEHLSEDEQMRRKALAREKWVRDQAELKAEGLEEGMEKGLLLSAKKMIEKGFPAETVASTLDMPLEKVKSLIKQ